MRPEWLSVPAADPPPDHGARSNLGDGVRVPVRHGRNGVQGWEPSAARHGRSAAETRWILFAEDRRPTDREPVIHWGHVSGSAVVCDADARPLRDLRGAPGPSVEILGPGLLGCRRGWPGGAAGPDRHRLDVMLSVGRHAAERARLAGCERLVCLGACDLGQSGRPHSPGLPQWPADTARDPYEELLRRDRFALAAMVGAAIAGAQMGIRVDLTGCCGRLAGRLAGRLNAAVAHWLRVVAAGSGPPAGSGRPDRLDRPPNRAEPDPVQGSRIPR